jgi:hypothetical protein
MQLLAEKDAAIKLSAMRLYKCMRIEWNLTVVFTIQISSVKIKIIL